MCAVGRKAGDHRETEAEQVKARVRRTGATTP